MSGQSAGVLCPSGGEAPCREFATDGIFSLCGRCTVASKLWARSAVVAFPLLLACGGPELYLPLLAFAGAYPTNFLFGLIPCLAALALRRSQVGRTRRGPPRLVPGGQAALWTLACLAILLIAVSAVLAWTERTVAGGVDELMRRDYTVAEMVRDL